jgi:hypothetical protein
MFRKHHGGTAVKGGFYWNTADWEVVVVEGRHGTLPGGEGCTYLKMPTLLFIPLALTFGALYYVFLPFIGFAMLLSLIGRKTGRGMRILVLAMRKRFAFRPAVDTTRKPAQMAEAGD